MDFRGLISDNMAAVSGALYVIGSFMKAVPKIPDWTIPLVLTFLGAAAGAVTGGLDGAVQGVLCAGAAVLANQIQKQTLEGLNKSN